MSDYHSTSTHTNSTHDIPLSIYVHIPWCVKKCPYCDFNSHETKALPEKAYIQALITDLNSSLERHAQSLNRPIKSIFFGGGTPSLFSANAIDSIIEGLRTQLTFDNDIEITLEANPGTVEANKFKDFFNAGINRLSIGVQSFSDAFLPTLGRIHDARAAHDAIEQAQIAGFGGAKGINVDLMFGLPNQTIDESLQDIQQAILHNVAHISHYQLTLEPGTAFFYRPPALPKEDTIWDMQQQCQAALADAGYGHYEVSAYSQVGKQCRHNLNYWQYGDYLGLGAGAHGKLTQRDEQGTVQAIIREAKHRSPDKYMRQVNGKTSISMPLLKSPTQQALGLIDTEAQSLEHTLRVPKEEQSFEFMMNALRLTQGVDLNLFETRTQCSIKPLNHVLSTLANKALISKSALRTGRIQTTKLGQQFLNDIISAFLNDE